ncbi:MAG: hypothetical protein ACK56E_13165, partial [Planctomyces sp.]
LLYAIETHAGSAQSRWLSASLPPLSEAEAVQLAESSSVSEAVGGVDVGEGIFAAGAEAALAAEAEAAEAVVSDEVGAAEQVTESVTEPVTEPDTEPVEGSTGVGGLLGRLIQEARTGGRSGSGDRQKALKPVKREAAAVPVWDGYEPRLAIATPLLPLINCFRSINPLYGLFLAEHMHRASHEER